MKIKSTQSSKEKIFNTAKKMMYENGYKKTTIEKIAQNAGVPKGLVTYYYKKEKIVSDLYLDFYIRVENRVASCLGEKLENHFQRHFILSKIFYNVILKDKNNTELYMEIVENELLTDNVHRYVRDKFQILIHELNIDISPLIFDRLLEAEYGAKIYLTRNHINRITKNLEKSKDFLNFLSSISVRLAGISNEEIENNISKCEELMKELDYSDLKFIVWQ